MGAKNTSTEELERGVASLLAQWETSDLLASEAARAIVRWVLATDRLMNNGRHRSESPSKRGALKADLLHLKDSVL